jgi:hypothetical protein
MALVFVFGSNLLGIHGAGAAKAAATKYGAERGVGCGRTGNAYAIPTKRRPTMAPEDILKPHEIAPHVAQFLDYARANPNDAFMTTRIGCGLAGWRDEDIAPLFIGAPGNVLLPTPWHEIAFGRLIHERVSFEN